MGAVLVSMLGLMAAAHAPRSAQARDEWLDDFMDAAHLLGLADITATDDPRGALTLSGRIAGRWATFSTIGRRRESTTATEVRLTGGSGLTLRLASAASGDDNTAGESTIALGEPTFDAYVALSGDEVVARSLLDRDTRRLVREMLGGRLAQSHVGFWMHGCTELRAGDLWAEVPVGPAYRERLGATVRSLLTLAPRFDAPVDAATRLASTVVDERFSGLRHAGFVLLLERYREHAATRLFVERALADPSPAIRLRAAMEVGERGSDVLREVAGDPTASDATCAEAVRCLDDRLEPSRAIALLASSGRGERVDTARALIGVLRRSGSVDAVLPIREAADRYPSLCDVARDAVAAIQSRLDGAAPHQVSLVNETTGQVSLTGQDTQGRVTLTGHDT